MSPLPKIRSRMVFGLGCAALAALALLGSAPQETRRGGWSRGRGGAFPVAGVTNSVMETCFQSQNDAAGAGGNSCMSCHYRAGQADFSWTLMRDAH